MTPSNASQMRDDSLQVVGLADGLGTPSHASVAGAAAANNKPQTVTEVDGEDMSPSGTVAQSQEV